MKSNRRNRLLALICIWLCVLAIWFFCSETAVNLIFPGWHGVELWLITLLAGAILITLIAIVPWS
jgi:hypothetical protein